MVCRARKTRPTSSDVAAVLVQLQQSRFQLHKNLARLFPKALLELVGIDCIGQRPTPLYLVSLVAAKFSKPASARAADHWLRRLPLERKLHGPDAFASRLAAHSNCDRGHIQIGRLRQRARALLSRA